MIGRTYLEKGRPVTVLVRSDWKRRSPRNVLVRREDGTLVVRPFRGLRKVSADQERAGSALFFDQNRNPQPVVTPVETS